MVVHFFFFKNRVLMVRPRPQMQATLHMAGATELRASRPLEDGLVRRWITMLLKCLVDQVAIWSNGRGKAWIGTVGTSRTDHVTCVAMLSQRLHVVPAF